MPPHDTYIETHLGTGVVMRAKPAAARSIGIDLDPLAPGLATPWPGVDLVVGDCVDYLAGFDFSQAGRVLVYADPPYVEETRTSDKRYRCDYSEADHRRLIAQLRQLPAAVILSGYPSALYDELVGDWRSIELQAMTRGGVRTEKVWFSFPAGDVAWASLAGRNFTDRQRIKRKAARWAANWRKLPPGERLAVLSAILAEASLDADD